MLEIKLTDEELKELMGDKIADVILTKNAQMDMLQKEINNYKLEEIKRQFKEDTSMTLETEVTTEDLKEIKNVYDFLCNYFYVNAKRTYFNTIHKYGIKLVDDAIISIYDELFKKVKNIEMQEKEEDEDVQNNN